MWPSGDGGGLQSQRQVLNSIRLGLVSVLEERGISGVMARQGSIGRGNLQNAKCTVCLPLVSLIFACG